MELQKEKHAAQTAQKDAKMQIRELKKKADIEKHRAAERFAALQDKFDRCSRNTDEGWKEAQRAEQRLAKAKVRIKSLVTVCENNEALLESAFAELEEFKKAKKPGGKGGSKGGRHSKGQGKGSRRQFTRSDWEAQWG